MDENNAQSTTTTLTNCGLTLPRKHKLKSINEALKSGESALFRQLAISDGGLVRDEFRRKIWPDLLDLGYFYSESVGQILPPTPPTSAAAVDCPPGPAAPFFSSSTEEEIGSGDDSHFRSVQSNIESSSKFGSVSDGPFPENDDSSSESGESSSSSASSSPKIFENGENGLKNAENGLKNNENGFKSAENGPIFGVPVEGQGQKMNKTKNHLITSQFQRQNFTSPPPFCDFSNEILLEKLKLHREHSQVLLDVHRTLARFPPNVTDERRLELQAKLTPIIVAILISDPDYRYYQGFHDVCLTVLLVLDDPQQTYQFCTKLARTYFRPYLVQSLDEACKSLQLIYPLIYAVDRELFLFLDQSEVGTNFAVSWVLTWFAHVIDEYKPVVRLYDLFLASHPLTSVYLTASLVLFRGSDMLRVCDCDMPSVHSFLSKMPKNLPLEALVADAQDLFSQYPPSKLAELNKRVEKDRQSRPAPPSYGSNRLANQRAGPSPSRYLIGGGGGVQRLGVKALVWGVATAAAAYYLYNHYNIFKFY